MDGNFARAADSAASSRNDGYRGKRRSQSKDLLPSLPMRHMPAILQNDQLRWPRYAAGNAAGKLLRAVFIPVTMNRQDGAANPAKPGIQGPSRKTRGEPCFGPCLEHPSCPGAVPPRQFLQLLRILEHPLCGTNTGQGARLDEALRGFGDHRLAGLLYRCCDSKRHRTTNTVSEQ